MPSDRSMYDGFGYRATFGTRGLAESVLERAGRNDAEDAVLSPAAIEFLSVLANRLIEILWNDDRRVDVPSRARAEAKELLYSVERLDAPGILYAIAPWTELPRGTIGDLHRACRPKIAEALIPFIGRILRSWCTEQLIHDVSRRAS